MNNMSNAKLTITYKQKLWTLFSLKNTKTIYFEKLILLLKE